jgi:hypothetical protein
MTSRPPPLPQHGLTGKIRKSRRYRCQGRTDAVGKDGCYLRPATWRPSPGEHRPKDGRHIKKKKIIQDGWNAKEVHSVKDGRSTKRWIVYKRDECQEMDIVSMTDGTLREKIMCQGQVKY